MKVLLILPYPKEKDNSELRSTTKIRGIKKYIPHPFKEEKRVRTQRTKETPGEALPLTLKNMVTIVEIALKYVESRIPSLKKGIILHNKRTPYLGPQKQKPIQGITTPLLKICTIRNIQIRLLKDPVVNINIRSVEKMMMKKATLYQTLKKTQFPAVKIWYQGNIVTTSE